MATKRSGQNHYSKRKISQKFGFKGKKSLVYIYMYIFNYFFIKYLFIFYIKNIYIYLFIILKGASPTNIGNERL